MNKLREMAYVWKFRDLGGKSVNKDSYILEGMKETENSFVYNDIYLLVLTSAT